MGTARQSSESVELAVALTLSGGLMDAYSYLVRGHVFANAQTGNMLLLGVGVASGDPSAVAHYGVPVLAFAAGIALAQAVRVASRDARRPRRGRLHWRQVALAVEILLLTLVAAVPEGHNLAANSLASLACGIQVQAFRKLHGRSYASTMCIGNLRAGTQRLVDFALGRDGRGLPEALAYYGVIACFVLGAVAGYLVAPALGTRTILVSCALLAVAFAIMLRDRERGRTRARGAERAA